MKSLTDGVTAGESTCEGIEKIGVGKSGGKEWSFKFGDGMSKGC